MRRGKPESTDKGKHGVGSLVRLSPTKARIDFDDKTQSPIEVSDETFPEILLNVFNKMPENAMISVDITLDTSGTRVMFARPLMGTFDFKFKKFYAPKDQKPAIEIKTGKGDKAYGQFSAVLEVQKKTGAKNNLWKGAQYSVFFFDAFGKDEDGNLLVLSKGDNSDFLSDFLDAVGVGSQNIPYSENPLPTIEELALAEARIFSGDVRKVTNKGKSYANVVMLNTFMGTEEFDLSDDYPETDETDGLSEAQKANVEIIHPALSD